MVFRTSPTTPLLDQNLQPDGTQHMWTVQLDVDIPLARK
jgi:hypothetical protein